VNADLTGLLQAWSGGDAEALDQLAPLVQRELREMARRMLSSERQAVGWQPTDLVQESYVRLLDWHAVLVRVKFSRPKHRLAGLFMPAHRYQQEPIVGSPIRRQAGQRRRSVQPDSQLRRSTLLDVLPGRQVARAHPPRLFKSEQPSPAGSPTIARLESPSLRYVETCPRANEYFVIDTTPRPQE
jgi:hypothetical protein